MTNQSADQLIEAAVDAARKSDIIVAVVGESQGMSGEAASRADIGLPGRQLDLLKALKKLNKPLVVVLMNGRPMELNWVDKNADAILETWFAGTEGGNAIANVLFGQDNPSGKLTMTFPKSVGQIPVYYNHKSTGRPFTGKLMDKYKSRYLDVENEPLYPFGYGLSYTTFTYSPVTISSNTLAKDGTLTATVTVKNTGKREGREVVQLYVQDLFASVTRPVKELKNFKSIDLKAGESKEVSFSLAEKDLRFYNLDMKYASEPGEFRLFVGPNSRDVKEAAFTLQ